MLMETSAPPHLLMDTQPILPGGTHTIQMESGFPCPSSSLNSGSASSQSQSAASSTTQTIVQIQTAETNNNQIQHQNSHSQQHHHHFNSLSRVKSLDSCRVCGDGPARMHYGVPTCFGCKGFFRRTLKRTKEYTCRYAGNCVVDRYERNSCRFCRFKRCLEVGMDPKAVRPDRDAAGRSHPVRRRMSRGNMLGGTICETAFTAEQDLPADTAAAPSDTDEWVRKLPVEMRTLLMQIMNMEAMVHHGDTHESAKNLYPLQFPSIRHIFEDPSCLDGKRTEIRYEPYRQVEPEELTYLAHRRLIATVDTVDHLCALMDLHNPRDKIILAKAAYAPLTLFCAVSATARVTRNRDRLCLCNYGFVPRGAHLSYAEPYHFANRLVDRALDELVEPFRAFNFKEQEIVLMKAIVALNPYLPNLSTEATEQVADFRDRLQETLYNVVRESHPKEVASSRFGNLLLFLPNVMMLASIMMENLQFIQSFRHQDIGPLLSELLEDGDPESGQQAMLEDGSSSDLEQSMRHSLSSHSLASHSQSSDNLSTLLGTSGSSFQTQYSAPNLSGSMPTLVSSKQSQPQLASNDSDPDYNVTLTAESLRQQAAQHQQMEVDSPPESHPPALVSSPLLFPSHKPQFFIDPANGFAANQPPPQSEGQLMSRTTVAASKHVFTVEKSAGPPRASCCRERSATGGTSASQCRNGECPAALAAIFQQQQQQQQRFENNDTGIFFLGMQQGGQQPQNNNTAIAKSQSFPYFDPFFGAADSGDNSGSGGGGGGGGMPSSASHDNFHQMQR